MHIATLLLVAPAIAADNSSPSSIDLVDAINCKLDVPTYNGFAMSLAMDKGLARKLGWKKIKSSSPFMDEYQLPTLIKVTDSYSTRVIGFTSSSIVAILDLADPNVIASKEGIKNAMNSKGLDGGSRRFMGQRVLVDRIEPPRGGKFGAHITIGREISNFPPLPGKTLYGCSYRIEVLDENGKSL